MTEISDKEHYFSLIRDFEHRPFVQTEGWYDFHEKQKPGSVRLFVDNPDAPEVACLAHVKKLAGIKMLLIQGECLKSATVESPKIREFYRSFQSQGWDIIEVNSFLPYQTAYEIGIREAGYLRPVGLFSIHLSLWVDLTQAAKYNDNWKRNIKLAQRSELTFCIIENPQSADAACFAALYRELLEDKAINHTLTTAQAELLLSGHNFGLAIVSNAEGEWLSAIIFHKSGQHAGLLYATKSQKAKACGATFYMYNELFSALNGNGYLTFDMERLLPSTHSSQGVYLFKQGIKGQMVTYNGEWAWYKRSYLRPLMYFVKRFLMKRTEM